MKRSILILLLAFSFASCMLPNRVYELGTTENEFLSKDKWLISLAEKTTERTVYKKVNGQVNNHYTYLYYYFVDGKLTRIDEGERKPDVVIEHAQDASSR